MDLLQTANQIEKTLKENGYCGERWGSGCTVFDNPVRDVQFGLTDKVPTQEYIDSITPDGYKTTLKMRDDNYSIYVEKLETPEEKAARLKAQKEWEEAHADDVKVSYKESVPGSGLYDMEVVEEEIAK